MPYVVLTGLDDSFLILTGFIGLKSSELDVNLEI